VAGDEPVTSPDQHKPGHRKLGRIAALGTAAILLLLLFGNHRGRVEDIFLIVIAAGLVGMVIGDVVLRRNGLRSE
jgi:multisubunit Na+/H+ antiporter MnhB subunit